MTFKLSDLQHGQHLTLEQWGQLYQEISRTHRIGYFPDETAGVENIEIWPVATLPVGVNKDSLVVAAQRIGEKIKFTIPLR